MDSPQARIAFGRFVADPQRRLLLRDGRLVPLNGKAFELLLLFIERPGVALTRAALYDRLWPHSAVEDGNLSQTVYLLRRALDPAGDGRAFIETLPRYGYRFVAPVHTAAQTPTAANIGAWPFVRIAVAALFLTLATPGARGAPHPVPQAQAAYAQGLYQLSLRTHNALLYAREYFRTALHSDPRNADAYAGIAAAQALLAEYDTSRAAANDVAQAARDCNRALAIDSADSQALAVAGFIAYRFRDDPDLAEADLDRALLLDPENAAAHHWHGVLLLTQGRLTPAIAEFQSAHSLQPTSEVFSRWLARAYVYAQRPEDAMRAATDALRVERDDAPAWIAFARAQEQRGALAQSLQTLRRLARAEPEERFFLTPDEARLEVRLHARNPAQLASAIDRLAAAKQIDPFETALFFLTLGRGNRAAEILRAASPSRVELALERNDPRFHAVGSGPQIESLI